MKTKLCALASGLALAFAGTAAFAGSSANNYQTGDLNDSQITQAYNADATTDVVQIGALNSATADQKDNDGGWFKHDGSVKIDIYQTGTLNTAKATQTYTGDADSKIVQIGVLNNATTSQKNGWNQKSDVYQDGALNTVKVTQVGNNLNASSVQIGNLNTSTITQTGW